MDTVILSRIMDTLDQVNEELHKRDHTREYLDIKQVADLMRISVPGVRNLISREGNPLPYVRVGGRLIFIAKEVHAWMRDQRMSS